MIKVGVKTVAAKKAESKCKKLKMVGEVTMWTGELLILFHSRARVVDSIGILEYVQMLVFTECVVYSVSWLIFSHRRHIARAGAWLTQPVAVILSLKSIGVLDCTSILAWGGRGHRHRQKQEKKTRRNASNVWP